MKKLIVLAFTGLMMLSIGGCSSTEETTESFDLSSTINVYTRDASSTLLAVNICRMRYEITR